MLPPNSATATGLPTMPGSLGSGLSGRESPRAQLIRALLADSWHFFWAQAPTPEIKAAWVSEIRKVLTSQLQACRGERGSPTPWFSLQRALVCEGAGAGWHGKRPSSLPLQRPASTGPWNTRTACLCPRRPAPGEAQAQGPVGLCTRRGSAAPVD